MAFDFPSSPTVGQQFTPVAGTTYTYNGVGWTLVSGGGIGNASAQGRLTLQTATPVMTTTQSAKTTIFYSPYCGNLCPIYDGTNMVATPFTELSVATTDTTKSPAAIGVSKVNDWFIWGDAGTLRVGHGPDWTNDTTRSAGTALTMVNGILLNNAAITNGPTAQRGTYVGTTRSNASSQLDWIYGTFAAPPVAAALNVWNMYNRVLIGTSIGDTTASWSTNTGAVWREANADTTFEIRYVCGQAVDGITVTNSFTIFPGAGVTVTIGIGIDAANALGSGVVATAVSGNVACVAAAAYAGIPGLGYHFVAAIETINGVATAIYGTGIGNVRSGLTFSGRF